MEEILSKKCILSPNYAISERFDGQVVMDNITLIVGF